MEMFSNIDIETHSLCNRFCVTCLRNSHPDMASKMNRLKKTYMPMDMIHEILQQLIDFQYTGSVCLSHYNEPLMDERFVEIADLVRRFRGNKFSMVYIHTNGDYITEDLARDLDGILDRMNIAIYWPEPYRTEKGERIKKLFRRTDINILNPEHIPTHYTPKFPLQELIDANLYSPCTQPLPSLIIGYDGTYLLCCDDLVGEFNLGNFKDISLRDYWFGGKHIEIVNRLREPGGRLSYSYCSICPRSG